jgi:hypothetical protein
MISSLVRRSVVGRPALVVEEWVAKSADLNYQLTIARDGGVRFDFVKQAVTDQGVHKGHRMPSPLTRRQRDELADAGGRLGSALAADGYFGVVGIDAMVDPEGGLYPAVEINARNNMSTYQVRLAEEIVGHDRTALARHYPLLLFRPLPFRRLRAALDDILLERAGGTGIMVHGFATVNAAFAASGSGAGESTAPGQPVHGRLFALLAGDDQAIVDRLDAEVTRRLAALR